jgi:hypothetical protein
MVEGAPVLETSELAYVLVRLEQAVAQTAAGFRRGMMMLVLLFACMGMFAVVQGSYGVLAFIVPFIALFAWIGWRASAKTSPERMKPVVDAVRDAPEAITVVRHYQTSDSARVFVTDWLEIKTADHRLVIKAKDDWQRIYAALGKRCPNATFVP